MGDKKYFEAEIREGFYVPGLIKYGWNSQIKIWQEIDRICNRYGITYYAGWGTLLGTVRHKGYIPWDDDLDLCMKRRDYESFLEATKKELPDGYVINNIYNNASYGNCIASIFNNSSNCYDEDFVERFDGQPCHMGIDIFILDELPSDAEEENQLGEALDFLVSLIAQYDGLSTDEKKHQLDLVHQSLGVRIGEGNEERVIHQLGLLTEKIAASFAGSDSNRIVNMMIWQRTRKAMDCSWFEGKTELEFEGLKMPVPKGYADVLTFIYGNYMIPSNKGTGHNYPYFLVDYYRARQYYGLKDYEPDMMPNPRDGRERQRNNYDRWDSYIEKAELLETALEKAMDAGIVNLIAQSQIPLTRLQNRLREELEYEQTRKRDILFITCQAKHWNVMQDLYDREMANEKNNVLVLVLPYYRKSFDGSKGEMIYELDEYPEELMICDYKTIHLNEIFVDRIYTQVPWDEYDELLTVDEEYYCDKQRNCSELLVYVPYLSPDSNTSNNERADFTMQFLCRQPAAIQADRILLENSDLKADYMKQLIAFTGEQTEEIWDGKLITAADLDALDEPYIPEDLEGTEESAQTSI